MLNGSGGYLSRAWRNAVVWAAKLNIVFLRDRVFGYDLFISYDFHEGGGFAEALKTRLEGSLNRLATSALTLKDCTHRAR
jgi:hypothetical protein